MMKKQFAAAVIVASLGCMPVAIAQNAGVNNTGRNIGAANGARGAGNVNNTGTVGANTANYSGANRGNGAANGAPSQRTSNEYANGQGAIVTISPSGVREIQQALNRLGYFAGPVNGVWDRTAANAMLQFQEAHGLEPTGDVNFSSITALGLWDNIIGDPLGNGHKALTASNGVPPPRGGKANVGGSPLPSQRITNEAPGGGQTTGSAGGGAAGAGSGNRR